MTEPARIIEPTPSDRDWMLVINSLIGERDRAVEQRDRARDIACAIEEQNAMLRSELAAAGRDYQNLEQGYQELRAWYKDATR